MVTVMAEVVAVAESSILGRVLVLEGVVPCMRVVFRLVETVVMVASVLLNVWLVVGTVLVKQKHSSV